MLLLHVAVERSARDGKAPALRRGPLIVKTDFEVAQARIAQATRQEAVSRRACSRARQAKPGPTLPLAEDDYV